MITNLHNDLLSYLIAHPQHSPFDAESRTSFSQLRAGRVSSETFAISTITEKRSAKKGWRQAKLYKNLLKTYPEYLGLNGIINPRLAIENASSLLADVEPLTKGIERLHYISREIDKPLYISLTWNMENRFGGGAHTKVGLKEDGKRLLEAMEGECHAVDLSHTSDALAFDILNFLAKKKLSLKVIASHSNFRTICDAHRNLPDEIAQEIVRQKGLIGLNAVRLFVGTTLSSILRHIEHAKKAGWGDFLGIGADFFSNKSVPLAYRKKEELFFPELKNAADSPFLIKLIEKEFGKNCAQKIASGNASQFFKQLLK